MGKLHIGYRRDFQKGFSHTRVALRRRSNILAENEFIFIHRKGADVAEKGKANAFKKAMKCGPAPWEQHLGRKKDTEGASALDTESSFGIVI